VVYLEAGLIFKTGFFYSWFHLRANGTATGTGTVLIYFLELETGGSL